MKKITLIFLLIWNPLMVFAQKNEPGFAGVYLTQDDFVSNHLSCKINTGDRGNKVEFPGIADWALTVKIVTPDSVRRFKAGSIYGYYENGRVYRFFLGDKMYVSDDFYRIEESNGLVIYTSEFNGGNDVFYSVDLTSPIHKLSLKNLKHDFIVYPAFVRAVRHLNRKAVRGDLGKRDGDGNFIVNKIFASTVRNTESYRRP